MRDKPIIIAMASKSVELLRCLCDKGADVNAANDNGTTALHMASQYGWVAGIQQLLDHGAKLIQNKQGNTPMHIAAEQGNHDVIRFFVQVKAEGQHVSMNEYMMCSYPSNYKSLMFLSIIIDDNDDDNDSVYYGVVVEMKGRRLIGIFAITMVRRL